MRVRQGLRRIRELSRPLAPLPTGVQPLLRPTPAVRAVLFDVYGTLIISAAGEIGAAASPGRPQPVDSLAEAFGALRLPLPPQAGAAERLLESIIRARQERSRAAGVEFPEVDIVSVYRELLRRLGGLAGTRLPSGPRLAARLALEHELRRNPTWGMPGAGTTLASLKARGLLLGIVSNAQFYTPWLFPAHLGADLRALGFTPALCSWSYRRGCAKPSADLFRPVLRALERRGVVPSATLVVGNDRRNDVLPASRLGCRAALFAGDARSYRPREQEPPTDGPQGDRGALVKPHLLLTALPQLLEVLAQ